MNWEYLIVAVAVFPLFMLLLTRFIQFENHTKRVDLLEVKYAIPIDESILKETG